MTRSEIVARETDGSGASRRALAAPEHAPRTRRDLLAHVFGWTAAIAAATIHTPADALSEDVFDGGTP